VRSYRIRRKVFGGKRTVLMTCNENLFVAESQPIRNSQRIRRWDTHLQTRHVRLGLEEEPLACRIEGSEADL